MPDSETNVDFYTITTLCPDSVMHEIDVYWLAKLKFDRALENFFVLSCFKMPSKQKFPWMYEMILTVL